MKPRWSTVEKYAHAVEAATLKSFLEGQGIPCVILGWHVVQMHPLMHDPIEVQVPTQRLSEAQMLIEACRNESSPYLLEAEKDT